MTEKNQYKSLLKIAETIHTIHDTAVLMDTIMEVAIEAIAAERGFILLKNPIHGQGFEAVSARNMSKEKIASLQELSSSVVNQVLESKKAVISTDAQTDKRFQGAESVVIQQIKSVICTPLHYGGEVIGAIYMDTRLERNQFNESNLYFLDAFASQAATAINNTRLLERLRNENKTLKKQLSVRQLFPEMIGRSKAMLNILEMIRDVADSTASVLIEGESGTGKEMAARALHMHSSRNELPLIPIFCGSLSENLFESELFGHKKGAFTGATQDKKGLFEEADGGTVFLDEIADISLNAQTKLLRILQEGEIKRVGETKIRKIDVRIISATNQDLWKRVEQGHFREDLYYRLNVINIRIPPLRERREDILPLADHFLRTFAQKNKKQINGLSRDAQEYLLDYHWPGNIRELENSMERAAILTRQPEISADLFHLNKNEMSMPIGKTLKEINKYAILKTINMTGNNRTKAAKILGVSRRWLQYQLKNWGMVDGN